MPSIGAEDLGHLDGLVVNAGGPPPGQALDLSDEQWLGSYQLLIGGPLRLLKLLVPKMTDGGGTRRPLTRPLPTASSQPAPSATGTTRPSSTPAQGMDRLGRGTVSAPGASFCITQLAMRFEQGIAFTEENDGFFNRMSRWFKKG